MCWCDAVRGCGGCCRVLGPLRVAVAARVKPPRPVLAQDRVRHVGDPIAMVVAETLDQARDAAEQIGLEIDELPVGIDPGAVVQPGAPAIWPDCPNNVALDWQATDEVLAFVERHELAVDVLLGQPQTARDWGVSVFPTYYILDERKRVAHRDFGYSTLLGLWIRSVLA